MSTRSLDEIPDDWVDEIPQAGDTAAVQDDPEKIVEVIGEHQLTAGEIVTDGETIAEQMDVAADRRVVMAVPHDDIAASPQLETIERGPLLAAVDAAAVVPEMWPVSLLAPLPEELVDDMLQRRAKVIDHVD